jgi:hypothetical protein
MRPLKLSGNRSMSSEMDHAVLGQLSTRTQALDFALRSLAPEADIPSGVRPHVLRHIAQFIGGFGQWHLRLEVRQTGQATRVSTGATFARGMASASFCCPRTSGQRCFSRASLARSA